MNTTSPLKKYKVMKRLTLLLGAALLLASACSPETFTMNIEMRYPSKSGLDFSRKTMAVVYADDGAESDTTFLRSVASGFARKMEEDYFGGAEVIQLYHVPGDTAALARKPFLQDLIMDTGDDVIFYFSTPEYGAIGMGENKPSRVTGRDSAYVCPVIIPFKLKVSAYDSMDKADRVLHFNGSSSVNPQVYNNGNVGYDGLVSRAWDAASAQAEQVGAQATGNFLSTWKAERYSFYYYDSFEEGWNKAAQAAYEFRWADAINGWTKLVQKYRAGSSHRACAEYNLASAFYILGNYSLATSWLDRADADCTLSLSPGLRKRIALRTK